MRQGRQRAPLRAALLLLLILWARSCVPLFAQETAGKISHVYTCIESSYVVDADAQLSKIEVFVFVYVLVLF